MKISERIRRALYALLPLLLMWLLFFGLSETMSPNRPRTVSYTELVTAVRERKVDQAELRADQITARLRPEAGKEPSFVVAQRIPNMDESALLKDFEEHGVVVSGKIEKTSWWGH